jgi:hypothetical protein
MNEENFDIVKAVKDLVEYVGHLANEITEIKVSIMDDLINPIKNEYEQMQYDNALSDWKCKFAEKLEPFNDKLKAIEGEDFDIMKQSFDDFTEDNKGFSDEEYVEALAEKVQGELDAIGKAFGVEPENIEEVKIETKDGEEVEAEVEDGEVTKVETENETEVENGSAEVESSETETPAEETQEEPAETAEETAEETVEEPVERPEGATDTPDSEEENYKYWEEVIKGNK